MNKKLAGVFVCAAWVIGTNAALAGEITGNGKWIAGSPDAPLNGKSECAYSGRQDDPNEEGFQRHHRAIVGTDPEDDPRHHHGPRRQSGQLLQSDQSAGTGAAIA